MDKEEVGASSDRLVIKIWAAFIILLLLLTRKLWTSDSFGFPRVPILELPSQVAFLLQYVALIGLAVGLLLIVVGVNKLRPLCGLIAFAFVCSFLSNQHCLQPWAWQGFIIATLFACLPIAGAKKWIAWLMVSIYIYSAIGKFDYQFVNSLGADFLNVILGWCGLELDFGSSLRPYLVLLFPIGELLVGLGLIFSRTRKLACWMAVALHLALILILSPLGLNHRLPVMVWNLLSIVLVCWLFTGERSFENKSNASSSLLGRFATAFAFVVLLGPMLRPIQLWDHWLAWGLYSPSNSRVELFIADSAKERIREDSVKQYFSQSNIQYGTSEFLLSKWSLDELGVPIYPDVRFQKAVAIDWLERHELAEYAVLNELGASNPWTGERTRSKVDLRGMQTRRASE